MSADSDTSRSDPLADLDACEFGEPARPPAATRMRTMKHPGLMLPATAIRWKGAAERTRWLVMWRSAVMRAFDTHTRAVKVCWALEGLAAGKGHAFVGNEFLADQTGISVKRLDETLTLLERTGAIVRTRVATRKGRSRRIYLSAAIINGNPPAPGGVQSDRQSPSGRGIANNPPVTGGVRNPPAAGESDPPVGGGIEAIEGMAATRPHKNGGRA